MTPSHRGRALAVIAGGSSAGTPPRQALAGYLAVRRSLGYKLDRPEKLLAQFIGYLEDAGAATVTTDHAPRWLVTHSSPPHSPPTACRAIHLRSGSRMRSLRSLRERQLTCSS